MAPRLTDWSLALATALATFTGFVSLISGTPGSWPVFALHGIVGLWLLPLVFWKTRRVWRRLHPRRWDGPTLAGIAVLLVILLALFCGIGWVAGLPYVIAGYNLLNWHIVFGLLLMVAISLHMIIRARPLRRRELQDRRQLLRWTAALSGAALLYPLQQSTQRALGWRGAERRFTGSYERASYTGNAFPTVSWVADNPLPLATETWQLTVAGLVTQPLILNYADIVQWQDELDATLDCTGGFYSAQQWRGVWVTRLLEQAQPLSDARWVRFVSVTGYRWSFPLAWTSQALLATHLGGEPLSHGHGAPLRLVAPGRRGFQWIKWVVQIDLLSTIDTGQLVAIYSSSLTPEGRGER